jgi:molybdate transport system substrate-binding protein
VILSSKNNAFFWTIHPGVTKLSRHRPLVNSGPATPALISNHATDRHDKMNIPSFPRRLILVTLLVLASAGHAFAGEVLVAAASDLSFPIKEIISQFEQQTGHRVKLMLGSSGNFQAQIANGAPFDVYLSADVDYIRQLDRAGLVEPDSLYIYAVGRLVIWVPNASPIDVQRLGIESLLQPAAKRIAIANPDLAPYGRATVAAMRHYNVYDRVAPRLVLGENVAQTAQFVSSGAADIGIIAHSTALSDPMRAAGKYWEIPTDAHPRLDQGMAILKQARKSGHLDAARAFHDWFRNDSSRAILKKYGFSLP